MTPTRLGWLGLVVGLACLLGVVPPRRSHRRLFNATPPPRKGCAEASHPQLKLTCSQCLADKRGGTCLRCRELGVDCACSSECGPPAKPGARKDTCTGSAKCCPNGDCPSCLAPGRPTLYTKLFPDGAGTTVSHLLDHAQWAALAGFQYGGAATHKAMAHSTTAHDVDQRSFVRLVFGTERVALAGEGATMPKGAREVKADALAKLDAHKLKPSDAVFLTDKYPPPVPKDAPGARSRAEFFAQLSEGLGCFTRAFAPRLMFAAPHKHSAPQLRVAAHIRRGDIDNHTQPEIRWVTNECVGATIQWVRAVVAGASNGTRQADAHVFSSLEQHSGRTPTTSADFELFRRRGVSVHLDDGKAKDKTDTALLHWAHFVAADVFIAGLGSFSNAPSTLNANCVLHPSKKVGAYHCYRMDDNDQRCVLRALANREKGNS